MRRRETDVNPKFDSIDEEREYWETRGPLGSGKRGRVNKPVPEEQRRSFLSVRLSGDELTRLRDLAGKNGSGPSTFARQVLLAFMELVEKRGETQETESVRTVSLEEVCESFARKMPDSLKQQMVDLFKSTSMGDIDNPSVMIFDQEQLEVFKKLGAMLTSFIIESANPSFRVITPYDSNYDRVKATLEVKGDSSNRIQV